MRRLLLSLRIEHSDRAPADCVPCVCVCVCVRFVCTCLCEHHRLRRQRSRRLCPGTGVFVCVRVVCAFVSVLPQTARMFLCPCVGVSAAPPLLMTRHARLHTFFLLCTYTHTHSTPATGQRYPERGARLDRNSQKSVS